MTSIKNMLNDESQLNPTPESEPHGSDQPVDEATIHAAESLLTAARFEPQPAADAFKQRLLAQLKEARTTAPTPEPSRSGAVSLFKQLMNPRAFMPILASLVIIAMVVTVSQWMPWQNNSWNQRVMINAAHAQDNFEVVPTRYDSLGVSKTSSFVIKSKEPVDPQVLKSTISLEPQADFDFEKISDTEFRVTPIDPLAAEKVYTLHITAAYVANSGLTVDKNFSWAFQIKDTFSVLGTLPGDKSSGVPINSGIEVQFNDESVSVEEFQKAFSVQPAVTGRFEKHRDTLVFIPEKLDEGAVYTVTIAKNVGGEDVARHLANDLVFQFEVQAPTLPAPAKPFWQFTTDSTEFGSHQVPLLPVTTIDTKDNVQTVSIFAYPDFNSFAAVVKERKAIPAWAYHTKVKNKIDTSSLMLVKTFSASAVDRSANDYNKESYVFFPEALPHGYYVVETTVEAMTSQTLLQITDLVGYTQTMREKTVVWVNSLATKQGVANARIVVDGIDQQVTTTADGVAVVPTPALTKMVVEGKGDIVGQSMLVSVISDTDAVIMPLWLTEYGLIAEPTELYWKYLATDRPMYLPNDKMQVNGFVKARKGADNPVEVKAVFRNYAYQVSETTMPVAVDGSFIGEMPLVKVLPGYYYLDLMVNDDIITSTYIQVSEYRKPAYQISVTPHTLAFLHDAEKAEFDVAAAFFDGTPVPDLSLQYAFGAQSGDVTTDAQGKAFISVSAPPVCNNTRDCYGTMNTVSFIVKPTLPEFADISGMTSVTRYNADFDVWARVKQSRTDATATITADHIDIDAINRGEIPWQLVPTPQSGVSLNVAIHEVYYTSQQTGMYYDFINKVTHPTFSYERHDDVVGSFTGMTGEDGTYTTTFPTKDDKSQYYYIDVTATAGGYTMTTQSFSYFDEPYGGSEFDSYSLEREEGNDGTFTLNVPVSVQFSRNEVTIPATEKNHYLYIVAQQGILDFAVSSAPVYTITPNETHVPNFGVLGAVFDGTSVHSSGSGWWYGESVNFSLNTESRKIDLQLEADQASYEPGEQAFLKVTATTKDGQPVKTTVNLNLIDEAYYTMAGSGGGAVAQKLYQNVPLGIGARYATHDLADLRDNTSGGGAEMGGCFVGGTQILMADGSTKSIETIKVGDKILTYASPRDRRLVSGTVSKTFEHIVNGYLEINGKINVTPEHRMFINGGWQTIGSAQVGDRLLTDTGAIEMITSIVKHAGSIKVYNFTVDEYHTYFADGVYVHNDKGGDGVREIFEDVALYANVMTDDQGQATVAFVLPDNITSWRVLASSITPDLLIGQETKLIPVSMPAFVEMNMNRWYLKGDQPQISARAYGKELKSKDAVEFTLNAEGLGIKDQKTQGVAFTPTYLNLPLNGTGKVDVTVGMKAGKFEDAVKLPTTVVDSRLLRSEEQFGTPETWSAIPGSATRPTTITFTDRDRGQYYYETLQLAWMSGKRVDQAVARELGQAYAAQYFSDSWIPEGDSFNFVKYQNAEGCVTLLPYGSSDLEMTAKMAAVAPEKFDRNALVKCLKAAKTKDTAATQQLVWALTGLAALHEPVLNDIYALLGAENLTPEQQLTLSMALVFVGDQTKAREVYAAVMNDFGRTQEPYTRIEISTNPDDMLRETAKAMVIAAALQDDHYQGLWNYVQEYKWKSTEVLLAFESLAQMQFKLPVLNTQPVSFTLHVGDKTEQIRLSAGQSHVITVLPDQLANVRIDNVNGKVGMVSHYEVLANADTDARDSALGIVRTYSVNGKPTTSFKVNDIVEVKLAPTIAATAMDESYTVTDTLPAGLAPLSSERVWTEKCLSYPYSVEDNESQFWVPKADYWWYSCSRKNTLYYLARVVNPGTYRAEPAVIQGTTTQSSVNYSEAQTVTITP